ncbi:hypothetical protein QBC40DRAFT_293781 [Triangularia verruculosa]|uniref:Uncharacterized protein n=1 Tax=Triangularia verruculosa TaxID=2587418 RepID=A0AAN6XN40_9PEZI|nr:hypothetical protein QBC40DRAFT_293781 [Triangularia verruculosa]
MRASKSCKNHKRKGVDPVLPLHSQPMGHSYSETKTFTGSISSSDIESRVRTLPVAHIPEWTKDGKCKNRPCRESWKHLTSACEREEKEKKRDGRSKEWKKELVYIGIKFSEKSSAKAKNNLNGMQYDHDRTALIIGSVVGTIFVLLVAYALYRNQVSRAKLLSKSFYQLRQTQQGWFIERSHSPASGLPLPVTAQGQHSDSPDDPPPIEASSNRGGPSQLSPISPSADKPHSNKGPSSNIESNKAPSLVSNKGFLTPKEISIKQSVRKQIPKTDGTRQVKKEIKLPRQYSLTLNATVSKQ